MRGSKHAKNEKHHNFRIAGDAFEGVKEIICNTCVRVHPCLHTVRRQLSKSSNGIQKPSCLCDKVACLTTYISPKTPSNRPVNKVQDLVVCFSTSKNAASSPTKSESWSILASG